MIMINEGNLTREEYTNALCKENGIRMKDDFSIYLVPSSSGDKEYAVYFQNLDGQDFEYMGVPEWKCNCPAGKYGNSCKHKKLVAEIDEQIYKLFGGE